MQSIPQRMVRWGRCLAARRTWPWYEPPSKHYRVACGLLAIMLVAARVPTPAPEKPTLADDRGAGTFNKACIMCHGRTGMGRHPLGPALVDAPWLRICREEDLASIILDGVYGPIPGTSSPYPVMAALGAWLSNKEIADVVGYVLRRWGDRPSTITPEIVGALRERSPKRSRPWSLKELAMTSAHRLHEAKASTAP